MSKPLTCQANEVAALTSPTNLTFDRITGVQKSRFLLRSVMPTGILLFLGGFVTTQANGVQGQENPGEATQTSVTAQRYLNLLLKTLGGKQLWTDFSWNDGWRLQQNAVTGHWRVIDGKNVRRAWGERSASDSVLRAHVSESSPPDQRVVVLLHGLLRSSGSMARMARRIEQNLDVRTIRFEYASSRREIAQHAIALRHFLETLPGRPRVDFVCHSMGNIVVRHMLADVRRDQDPATLLSRLERMVMLGPPNQGSDFAKQISKLGLFELVTGRGGMELGPAWEAFKDQLVTPEFPFMIVAGDTSGTWMKNPVLNGPSDLLVKVEEAKLDGCEQFHVVPVLHGLLMNDKTVQKLVVEFLKEPNDKKLKTSDPE